MPSAWSQNPLLWFLLPPSGWQLASHPSLLLAQWVSSVYFQQLVHSPVLVPLEEKDLPVGPGEGCVRRGWHPADEHAQRFGVESEVVFQLIKLPVL